MKTYVIFILADKEHGSARVHIKLLLFQIDKAHNLKKLLCAVKIPIK